MGSKVVHLLREQEKKARLRFWRLLMQMSERSDFPCPFTQEAPPGTIHIGAMPKYLRAPFVRAYLLRGEARKGEAQVFEEAINDLMLEHFRKTIARLDFQIRHFILAKEWQVFVMPL